MTPLTNAKTKIKGALRTQSEPLSAQEVAAARTYVSKYWAHLVRSNPKDEGSLIGLPHPYLVPSYAKGHEFDYDELFYWDSYFMVQAHWNPAQKELVLGILDDLIFLFKRFRIIPNSSQFYMTARSQPPFLSSFILDAYYQFGMSLSWLNSRIEVAKDEYKTVWMGQRKPNARQVYRGLSRYYDYNYLHDIAEAESGWDMTSRFNRKALNYLPVDLNALLFKYEMDFSRVAKINNNAREAAKWESAAEHRKQTMNELMWDKVKGLYYDYDFVKEKKGTVASLASYYPLWAGMVDDHQAKLLVKSLKRFEHKGGLATTDTLPVGQYVLGAMPTQWAYPNGWAPLHFLVVQGLERYGYHQEARRIATKWIKCNVNWFTKHHIFLEKYNVVSIDRPPAKGLYPSQEGFGWTNAVFERFCQDYVDRSV